MEVQNYSAYPKTKAMEIPLRKVKHSTPRIIINDVMMFSHFISNNITHGPQMAEELHASRKRSHAAIWDFWYILDCPTRVLTSLPQARDLLICVHDFGFKVEYDR